MNAKSKPASSRRQLTMKMMSSASCLLLLSIGFYFLWHTTAAIAQSEPVPETTATSTPAPPTVRELRMRAQADMRTFATAIETYRIDWNAYPPSSMNVELTLMRDLARKHPNANWKIPSFTSSITTPIAYMRNIFPDPFAKEEGRTFQYYLHPSGDGWIVWSAGPDGEYQLNWKIYDPSIPQPSPELLTGAGPAGSYSYDPTNGTESPGDLWRVKQ